MVGRQAWASSRVVGMIEGSGYRFRGFIRGLAAVFRVPHQ